MRPKEGSLKTSSRAASYVAKQETSKKGWLPLWVVPVLIAMAIGTVWLRLSVVRTTYSINQADQLIRELKQGKEQMELKVTALRSPRRLELLAKTKFKLTQPRSDQIIYLDKVKNEH